MRLFDSTVINNHQLILDIQPKVSLVHIHTHTHTYNIILMAIITRGTLVRHAISAFKAIK